MWSFTLLSVSVCSSVSVIHVSSVLQSFGLNALFLPFDTLYFSYTFHLCVHLGLIGFVLIFFITMDHFLFVVLGNKIHC